MSESRTVITISSIPPWNTPSLKMMTCTCADKLNNAQHGFTALQQILESFFEVAGVPGIRNIPADARIRHHQVYFPRRVVGEDSSDEPKVGGIHADDAVEAVVVGRCWARQRLAGG